MKVAEVIRNIGCIGTFAGYTLNVVNSLGQMGILHYPVGRDNVIENHIGNFGASVGLTVISHEALRIVGFSETYASLLTIGLVAGINIFVESALAPITPNPELVGDVLMGVLASGLTLMAMNNINVTKQIREALHLQR